MVGSKIERVTAQWGGFPELTEPESIGALIAQTRALNRVYAQLAEVFIRLEAEAPRSLVGDRAFRATGRVGETW